VVLQSKFLFKFFSKGTQLFILKLTKQHRSTNSSYLPKNVPTNHQGLNIFGRHLTRSTTKNSLNFLCTHLDPSCINRAWVHAGPRAIGGSLWPLRTLTNCEPPKQVSLDLSKENFQKRSHTGGTKVGAEYLGQSHWHLREASTGYF
jgi:hypothetical protein